MRKLVRAIVVKDGKLLLMKRDKFGQKFYSLVGGGIDDGETPEQALHREVLEESSVVIADLKPVITLEDPNFGTQYVYLCKFVTGQPALAADTEEAEQTDQGQNTYQPLWLPVEELPTVNLLPAELKTAIGNCLKSGWPPEPINLTIKG